MRITAFFILALVLTLLLAGLWWRLHMFHGWIAPPQYLAAVIRADGEGAYDRVVLEMYLLLLPLVGVVTWFFSSKGN